MHYHLRHILNAAPFLFSVSVMLLLCFQCFPVETGVQELQPKGRPYLCHVQGTVICLIPFTVLSGLLGVTFSSSQL